MEKMEVGVSGMESIPLSPDQHEWGRLSGAGSSESFDLDRHCDYLGTYVPLHDTILIHPFALRWMLLSVKLHCPTGI